MDGAGVKLKLWHNFDKSPTEQLVSRRTTALLIKVKKHLVSHDRATADTVREFIGGDWDVGHIWLVHRAAVPADSATGTLDIPQNWPLTRVARNSEATFVRLPGVERVPTFTLELVGQWIADVNAIEHGAGSAAPMEA